MLNKQLAFDLENRNQQTLSLAEDLLEADLRQLPKDNGAMRRLGTAIAAQYRLEEAVSIWKGMTSAADRDLVTHMLIGWGVRSQSFGQDKNTQVFFDAALETNSESGYAYYQLGQLYRELGRFPEAIAAIEKATRLPLDGTERSNLYAAIGYIYSSELQPPNLIAAESAYVTAIELDDFDTYLANTNTHLQYADVLRRQGRLEEAYTEYSWFLERRPDHYHGRVWRGVIAWQIYGDPQLAEADLLHAISIYSDRLLAYQQLIKLYEALGRTADADPFRLRVAEIEAAIKK